jgi:hypothetical protein
MQLSTVSERNLDLVLAIAQGKTLQAAGAEVGISIERTRQIVRSFCREYLRYSQSQGTPETFYPGPDIEGEHYFGESPYNNHKHSDPTTSMRSFRRLWNKGLAVLDIGASNPWPGLDRLEDLRLNSDYWIHQIKLLRERRALTKR